MQVMLGLRPHSNVVQLVGVCVNPAKKLAIITEFLDNGSLLTFLKNPSNQISTAMVLGWARGICAGVTHLHFENIVHRDLACRNILLTQHLDPKVSDFGLSRKTITNSSGQTKTDTGPLKWMAPEALMNRIYSTKSDVWAFGCVIVEMVTRDEPYPDQEVVAAAAGVSMRTQRPDIPQEYLVDDIITALKDIIAQCCMYDAQDRPDMKSIGLTLQQIQI